MKSGDGIYADLSSLAYQAEGKNSESKVQDGLQKLNLPNVQVVSASSDCSVFKQGSEIIIAYRGTNPLNLRDLANDVKIAFNPYGSNYRTQDFQNQVNMLKQQYPEAHFTFTGHSLGGNYAEEMAMVNNGTKAVTFNAAYPSYFSSAGNHNYDNITSYTVKGDIISGGDHRGQKIELSPGSISNHSIDNFTNQNNRVSLYTNSFNTSLQQNGLVGSYNQSNPGSSIIDLITHGEIGGVATQIADIRGFEVCSTIAFQDCYVLLTEYAGNTISDSMFTQICIELTNGIFTHNTYPFFSLHFNSDHCLYPVIHPAYQNTLVGEVIGFLDYYMKGFLNGGTYDIDFLKEWHKTQNCSQEYLRMHLIDLKKYCLSNAKGIKYTSLRELLAGNELEDEPIDNKDAFYQSKFSSSFRIIASQNKISKTDEILMTDPYFDVEYTINVMPDYQDVIDNSIKENGGEPEKFCILNSIYKQMALNIKEILPQLPIAKDYFTLLGIICFMSYYLTALKKIGKYPQFNLDGFVPQNYAFPKLLPPIPVRYVKKFPLKITYTQILGNIGKENQILLETFISQFVNDTSINFQPEMELTIEKAIANVIMLQIPLIEQNALANQSKNIQCSIQKSFKQYVCQRKQEVNQILNAMAILMISIKTNITLPEIKVALINILYVMNKSTTYYFNIKQKKIIAFEATKLSASTPEIISKVIKSGWTLIKFTKDMIPKSNAENNTLFDKLFQQFINQSELAKSMIQQDQIELIKYYLLSTYDDFEVIDINLKADSIKQYHKTKPKDLASEYNTLNEKINEQLSKAKKQLKEAKQENLKKNLDQLDESLSKCKRDLEGQLNSALQSIDAQSEQAICDQIRELNNTVNQKVPYDKRTNEINQKIQEAVQSIKSSVNNQIQNIKSEKINQFNSIISEARAKTNDLKNREVKNINDYYEKREGEIHKELLSKKNEIMIQINTDYDKQISQMISNVDSLLNELNMCGKSLITKLIKSSEPLIDTNSFHCSVLDIADSTYYKNMGDNYNIVGGCGFRLRPLEIQKLEAPQSFILQVRNTVYNTQIPIIHLQSSHKSYVAIKSNIISYTSLNINAITTKTLLSTHSQNQPFNNAEQKLLLSLCAFNITKCIPKQALTTNINNFNISAKDDYGMGILHQIAFFQNKEIHQAIELPSAQYLIEDYYGFLPIHVAAEIGNVSAIESILLRCPSCLDAPTNQGSTALILSSSRGHYDLVMRLIEKGANVNYKTPSGICPLYGAILYHHANVAFAIINKCKDIDVNNVMEDGISLLHLACITKQEDIAIALINKNANLENKIKKDGFTPMLLCCKYGLSKVSRKILSKNFETLKYVLPSGKTSLHIAAENQQIEIVKMLIEEYKCSVTISKQGYSPLSLSILNGNCEIAHYLCKYEPKSSIQKSLHLAGEHGMFEIGDQLILKGANPNNNNNLGISYVYFLIMAHEFLRVKELQSKKIIDLSKSNTLQIAAAANFTPLINYIMEYSKWKENFNGLNIIHYCVKADNALYLQSWIGKNISVLSSYLVEKGPHKNKSLQYIAAESGSEQCLRVLLTIIKEKDIENSYGERHLLYAAIESGNTTIIDLILEHCNINIFVDSKKNTALHVAVENGKLDLIEFLNKRAADFTICNEKGFTCIHAAVLLDDKLMLKEILKVVPRHYIPNDIMAFAICHDRRKCIEVLQKYKNIFTNTKTKGNGNKDNNFAALIEACAKGNVSIMEKLINEGANINLEINGQNPMLGAIAAGQIEIIDYLITKEANLFDKHSSENVFQYAVKCRSIEVLKYFSGMGLLPTKSTEDYKRIIDIYRNEKYIVNAMDNNFTEYEKDKTSLINSLKSSDIDCFGRIVKHFPINHKIGINDKWVYILHESCLEGCKWAIKLLLDNKCDPTLQDSAGNNILHSMILHYVNEKLILDIVGLLTSKQKSVLFSQKNNVNLFPIELAFHIGYDKLIFIIPDSLQANQTFNNGESLMHLAARFGNLDFIKKSLHINQDPNIRSLYNSTPLMIAAQKGNKMVISYLITQGADVNLTDNKGNTALNMAIKAKQEGACNMLAPLMLYQKQANRKGDTALLLASKHNLLSVIKQLIKKGFSPYKSNSKGNNALHLAAMNGNVNIISYLVNEIKMDVDIPQKKKNSNPHCRMFTPIKLASLRGKADATEMLFKFGAATFKPSEFTFAKAIAFPHQSSVSKYIYRLNITQEQLDDYWFAAAQANNINIISELIARKYPINKQNKDGMSALHYVSICNSVKSAILLLDYNADTLATTSNGDTPLHYSAMYGHPVITSLLINKINSANQVNIKGSTPLHLACIDGKLPVVYLLFKKNANTELKDNEGFTPSQRALENGWIEIVKTLYLLGDRTVSASSLDKLPQSLRAVAIEHQDVLQGIENLADEIIEKQRGSCLHLAVGMRNRDACILIIQVMGKDIIGYKNKLGQTAIDLSKKRNYNEISEVLCRMKNGIS